MDLNTIFQQNELAFYGARAVVLALAMLAFAFALVQWRRTGRRDMQRLFSELDESRNETRALSEHALQLTMQVRALQARFEDRQQLAVISAAPAQRGYDLALQMARNGSSPDEIVSASGVTRHEAALLTRLHNPANR
jgi:methylphosphotriester-DNA--protein-cysteine methyltransferase